MVFPRTAAALVGSLILSIAVLAAGFGCAAGPRIEVRDASNEEVESWTMMSARSDAHRPVWVSPRAVITRAHIAHAELGLDNIRRRAVVLELTDAGAARMERLSAENIGQPVAIFLDGELISAPVVQSRLSRRIIIIGATDEEANRIVRAYARK